MARSVFYYHLKRLKTADRYINEKESIKLFFMSIRDAMAILRVTTEMHNRGFMLNHKEHPKRLWATWGLKATESLSSLLDQL